MKKFAAKKSPAKQESKPAKLKVNPKNAEVKQDVQAPDSLLDLSQKEAIKKKVIAETMKKLRAKKLAMKQTAPKPAAPVKKIELKKIPSKAAVQPQVKKLV